jgi:hypothetical protein
LALRGAGAVTIDPVTGLAVDEIEGRLAALADSLRRA